MDNPMQIPQYNQQVIEYIEAYQKSALIKEFGLNFNIKNIFPSPEQFLDYIDKIVKQEYKNEDEALDMEIELKNRAFDPVVNATSFEYIQYKSILNSTELFFRKCVKSEYLDKIPYNATRYSEDANASIEFIDALDKPIIFFNSQLFGAYSTFCQLFI